MISVNRLLNNCPTVAQNLREIHDEAGNNIVKADAIAIKKLAKRTLKLLGEK